MSVEQRNPDISMITSRTILQPINRYALGACLLLFLGMFTVGLSDLLKETTHGATDLHLALQAAIVLLVSIAAPVVLHRFLLHITRTCALRSQLLDTQKSQEALNSQLIQAQTERQRLEHQLTAIQTESSALKVVLHQACNTRDALSAQLVAAQTRARLQGASLKHERDHHHSIQEAMVERLAAAECEAERWRHEAHLLLQGLGETIERQFERWSLSPAEQEVGLLLLKGLSLKEIAAVRSVSERTARQQARAIYQKAELSGRAELSAFFLEDLLLPHALSQNSTEPKHIWPC